MSPPKSSQGSSQAPSQPLSQASPQTPPQIFNRRLVRMRRERSARAFPGHDFLHRRAMADVVDRLETVKRDFPTAVFSGAGNLISMLTPACGVGRAFSFDSARARLPENASRAAADDETPPLAPESIDLYVSLLTLHAVNDLVGAMAQIRMALKPDGLFIAAMFGENTLAGFRRALYEAEAELTGGVGARVAPFATIQDAGQALGRAGFALPVIDVDNVSVRYEQPLALVRDLRAMGETRALASPPAPLRRGAAARALALFAERGGAEQFDIVYLTGWAPHESQQKPLRPGSATTSFEAAVRKARSV